MKDEILPNLSHRFIPYIQIHEFESLLFSDINVFKDAYDKQNIDFQILEETIKDFSSPEEINSRPSLAPSKRILKAIPDYKKVVDGNFLADEIGLDKIMDKCPLFRQWIKLLKSI